MKKSKRKIKGFTLVEIIVVLIIIGILASLVIPRFLSQPERAIIGEAQQMLGALRRAQAAYMDSTGNPAQVFTYALPSANATNTTPPDGWTRLGFQSLSNVSKFSYSCNAAGCTATRVGGDRSGARINISYGTGEYACRSGYALLDSADLSKGCTPA